MRILPVFILSLAAPALVQAADVAAPPAMPKKTVYSKPVVAPTSGTKAKKSGRTSKPERTVRYEGKRKIEEFRVRGRLTMVKITAGNAKPYYIYYKENWNSVPGRRGLDDTQRRPHWKIFSW